jgi:hypothetical protein
LTLLETVLLALEALLGCLLCALLAESGLLDTQLLFRDTEVLALVARHSIVVGELGLELWPGHAELLAFEAVLELARGELWECGRSELAYESTTGSAGVDLLAGYCC